MKLKIKQWLLKRLSNIKYQINHIKSINKPTNLYFLNSEKQFIEQFAKDIQDIDFQKALSKLIKGLDEQSIKQVYTILHRISRITANPSRFHDIFTKEELDTYDAIHKYRRDFKYNNKCYLDNYIFPDNNYPCVEAFYFRYHLNFLNQNTIDRMGGGGV